MIRKKILMASGGRSASGVRMMVVRERKASKKMCTGSERALFFSGCATDIVVVVVFAFMG
jgi:hypothetical protein